MGWGVPGRVRKQKNKSREQRAISGKYRRLCYRKARVSAAQLGPFAVFSAGITAGSASRRPAFGPEELIEAGAERQEGAPKFALALPRAQQKGRIEHPPGRNPPGEPPGPRVHPPPPP